MVCTLVQAIQIRTSKTTSITHSDALFTHNMLVVCDIFMAWSEGVP